MNETQMWNTEKPIAEMEMGGTDIDVPDWIDDDISPNTVMSICQGGCASGAYMPAVTYHTASETMSEHGDDVLQFIEDNYGELPPPPKDVSWSGLAVHYLSCAVELWAHNVQSELESTFYFEFTGELETLVFNLIEGIKDEDRAGGMKVPSMDLTVATDDDLSNWSYQTGDNSMHGDCYGVPHWAVVTLTRDRDPSRVVNEILEQWEDMVRW